VAVLDEVQAADAVHLDRRDHRAALFSLIERLPPLPVAVRDGPESMVEVARLLDRPDYRIQPDGPQAQVELTAEAQRADQLAEPQRLLSAGWWRSQLPSRSSSCRRRARVKSSAASTAGTPVSRCGAMSPSCRSLRSRYLFRIMGRLPSFPTIYFDQINRLYR
jgi:hypothetical protein